MKVSFICGRGIRAGIHTFRLSSKLTSHNSNFTISQGSRTSLGGPERWPGPLCVSCKVVVERRSGRAKNSNNSNNLMKINKNMAKFGERDHYMLKVRTSVCKILAIFKVLRIELQTIDFSRWPLTTNAVANAAPPNIYAYNMFFVSDTNFVVDTVYIKCGIL